MVPKKLVTVLALLLVVPACRAEGTNSRENDTNCPSAKSFVSSLSLTAIEQRVLDCIKDGRYKAARQILQAALIAEGHVVRNHVIYTRHASKTFNIAMP